MPFNTFHPRFLSEVPPCDVLMNPVSAGPYAAGNSLAQSRAVFTDSRITRANAPGGGGIVFWGNPAFTASTGQRHTLDIIRTTIDDCDAANSASAVIAGSAAHVDAESSVFVNNRGESNVAFYIYAGATGNISNCTISNNVGVGLGGGVGIRGSSAAFTGCTIENNTAVQGGGVKIMVESFSFNF